MAALSHAAHDDLFWNCGVATDLLDQSILIRPTGVVQVMAAPLGSSYVSCRLQGSITTIDFLPEPTAMEELYNNYARRRPGEHHLSSRSAALHQGFIYHDQANCCSQHGDQLMVISLLMNINIVWTSSR